MWTRFMDMHSGGPAKEPPHEYIYIESASEDEAKLIFYNRFGHNPDRVTCTCCGNDYSTSSDDTLAEVSAYDRKCEFDRVSNYYVLETAKMSLEQYESCENVLVIRAEEIPPGQRVGELPEQGYVWVP